MAPAGNLITAWFYYFIDFLVLSLILHLLAMILLERRNFLDKIFGYQEIQSVQERQDKSFIFFLLFIIFIFIQMIDAPVFPKDD